MKLRKPVAGDVGLLGQLFSDVDVMRFLVPPPPDIQEKLDAMIAHWQTHGFGFWIVEEKTTGKSIGYCGFRVLPPRDELEIGYVFEKTSWGKGYATESVLACLEWADQIKGVDEIVAIVHPENEVSKIVLQKQGFVNDKIRDGKYFGVDFTFWAKVKSKSPLYATSNKAAKPSL